MSRILITGAKGQLGTELRILLDSKNIQYEATDSKTLDVTNKDEVDSYFDKKQPDFVFHCAAYTAVDNAEDEDKKLNWEVNAKGTKNISKASETVGATLIYISTDYVFDGDSIEEYQVDDQVNPKNEYGRAKLAGEESVQQYCSKYYIVRTSWVFGEYGKNFVYTMLKLAETHKKLTVVADQFGRPTWTRTLAEFLLHIYNTNPEYGVYHLSNEDSCSWFEFASEILNDKEVEVQPVTSEEYPQKAYRPKHSVLNLNNAKNSGFEIDSWKVSLNNFMENIF